MEDTGEAGDGITSDPTVTGRVNVYDDPLANTLVQLDWDRDGIADGTATTGADGWFTFDARPGLEEGPVTMRARAQNEDDEWGNWATLTFTYLTHAVFDEINGFRIGVKEGIENWSLEIPHFNPGGDTSFEITAGNESLNEFVISELQPMLFNIDDNGILTTARPLDYEHEYQYELTLAVTQNGHTDETTLNLTVHDRPTPGVPVFDEVPEVVSTPTITLEWAKVLYAENYSVRLFRPDGINDDVSTDSLSHQFSLPIDPTTGQTMEGVYGFRAVAYNEIGESGEHSIVGSFKYDPTPNPQVPTIRTSSSTYGIEWDAVDNATSYLISYVEDGQTTTNFDTTTGTSWTPSNAPLGTFHAKVKALNSDGDSWSGETNDPQTNPLDWSNEVPFQSGFDILVTSTSPWNNNADDGSTLPSLSPGSGYSEGGIYVDDVTGTVATDPIEFLSLDPASKLQQDIDGWLPVVTRGRRDGWASANIMLPAGTPTGLQLRVKDGGLVVSNQTVTTEMVGTELQVAFPVTMPVSTATGVYTRTITVELVDPVDANSPLNKTIDIDTQVVWVNRDDDGLGSGLAVPNKSQLLIESDGKLLIRGNGTTAWFPNGNGGRAEGSLATLKSGGLHDWVLTFPGGEQHHFNTGGRLRAITDSYGRETTIEYQSGKIKRVIEPAELSGRTLTYKYDAVDGYLYQVNDFAGRDFDYNGNGLPGNYNQIVAPPASGSTPALDLMDAPPPAYRV